nr:hypothetical protein GCM10020093_041350 [Planobispora longispora]
MTRSTHDPRDDLRVGDAERDAAMAVLREHYAHGRLTHEELDERLGLALSARTGGDLARAQENLPDPYEPPADARRGVPGDAFRDGAFRYGVLAGPGRRTRPGVRSGRSGRRCGGSSGGRPGAGTRNDTPPGTGTRHGTAAGTGTRWPAGAGRPSRRCCWCCWSPEWPSPGSGC